ncbi:hypothetical protein ACQ5SO_04055 [Rhodovulum sp. DZ06]|uniref:hypothetical protein n=1 Tax=Rhodovulum sp. DZ06 TaxID=3425126 RepID=UPI003D32AF3B
MTVATSTYAPFGAETVLKLVNGVERVLRLAGRVYRGRNARKAARAQLKAMSVNMLDDLGLAGRALDRRVLGA